MNNHVDCNIDTVLTGLRNTPPPVGFEARVHQRLASQVAPVSAPRQRFTLQPRFAFAAALTMLALASIATLNRHRQTRVPQSFGLASNSDDLAPFPYADGKNSVISTGAKQLHRLAQRRDPCILPVGAADCTLREDAVGADGGGNPDAIALAETLAPSHPAPPLPLTQEEALLLRATRPGQPIEVAELDSVREPMLHALAEQREHINIGQYIHALLGPLAAAEALSPTPAPPDETQPVTVAEAPSSK